MPCKSDLFRTLPSTSMPSSRCGSWLKLATASHHMLKNACAGRKLDYDHNMQMYDLDNRYDYQTDSEVESDFDERCNAYEEDYERRVHPAVSSRMHEDKKPLTIDQWRVTRSR